MTNDESGNECFNEWLLIAHSPLSLFQTVCSCDYAVKFFAIQVKQSLMYVFKMKGKPSP